MTAVEPALKPAQLVSAWIDIALRSATGEGYGSERSAIFEALRSDPTHPVAGHLLALTDHPDAATRAVVLQLLTVLVPLPGRGDITEVGVRCLADPDEQVRRRAAWLVDAADHDRARILIQRPAEDLDPVARLALVEAVLGWRRPEQDGSCDQLPEILSTDPDPAVRLRAGIALAQSADAAKLASLQALMVEALAVAGQSLAGPGSRLTSPPGALWALALISRDRELECYERVECLLARPEPVCRLAGIDMALTAIRHWRAAASRLSAALAAALDDEAVAVKVAAAATIGASLELTRAHADALAPLLGVSPFDDVVRSALERIGDTRARTQDVPETVEALVGELETLARSTDPADDARRWWVVTRLGELGPAANAAVPLLEAILAADSKRSRGVSPAARLALLKITGDRGSAEQLLDGFMTELSELHAARRMNGAVPAQILTWLFEHGGVAERHLDFLHQLLRSHPRRVNPRALALLWRARDTEVADLVRMTLLGYVDDDLWGPLACEVLAEMGAAAADALPALDEIVDRKCRLGFHIGDLDAELRADEKVLAAARDAREAIRRAAEG